MIGPTKFMPTGGPSEHPWPIVEVDENDPNGIRVKAVIHQEHFHLSNQPVPPLSDPRRYWDHPIAPEAYDKLPTGKWDIDDQGNITRIELED